MTKNNNYSIDFINSKVIVTKKFVKEASTLGTESFKEMMELKTTFPTFTFEVKEIQKKENKKTYKGLTVIRMTATLEVLKGSDISKDFQKKISVYKNQRSKYALVKKYFLSLLEENELDTITPEQEVAIENVMARLGKDKTDSDKQNITSLNAPEIKKAV